jgi:hypothetical protein
MILKTLILAHLLLLLNLFLSDQLMLPSSLSLCASSRAVVRAVSPSQNPGSSPALGWSRKCLPLDVPVNDSFLVRRVQPLADLHR